MSKRSVLVVDDDESLRRVTQVQLEDEGYSVTTARDAAEASRLLTRKHLDLVITDLSMPGRSGVDLLREIRAGHPETTVILMTAFGTVESAVEAMRLGAYDYITKPVNPDNLRMVVARAMEHLSLRQEAHCLRDVLGIRTGFEKLVGSSQALLAVLGMADRAAKTDATVLIRGETGTGKELVAHGIHASSVRRSKPFVTINCGAIPAELLESELFGHVKGSFTGAIDSKKGRVEAANCGTLFLDEIGDMSLDIQVKVLRLLQHHEIEKVGAPGPTQIDVRIIAATHRDLRVMVSEGKFREDLYYRLNVVPIELPPLRERSEDIPALVQHFWTQSLEKQGRTTPRSPTHLLPYFVRYDWPGNVRELENLIERLVALSDGEEISAEELPLALKMQQSPLNMLNLELPREGLSLEGLEKDLVQQALIRFSGNQTRAAQYLGLSRKTLIYRMEKFGLRSESHT